MSEGIELKSSHFPHFLQINGRSLAFAYHLRRCEVGRDVARGSVGSREHLPDECRFARLSWASDELDQAPRLGYPGAQDAAVWSLQGDWRLATHG